MAKSEKENGPGRGARVRNLRQWFRRRPIAVAVCLVALIGLALGWNWLAAIWRWGWDTSWARLLFHVFFY